MTICRWHFLPLLNMAQMSCDVSAVRGLISVAVGYRAIKLVYRKICLTLYLRISLILDTESRMERERLHIGEVAARAGVNVQTLRYYERRGLLEEPERSQSGYRKYPVETVRLIKFIKRAQELGFTLTEAEDLLRLRQVRSRDRHRIRALAEEKVREVDEKIRRLKSIRDALGKLIDSCVCGRPELECPILEALEDRASPSAWMRSGSKRRRHVT